MYESCRPKKVPEEKRRSIKKDQERKERVNWMTETVKVSKKKAFKERIEDWMEEWLTRREEKFVTSSQWHWEEKTMNAILGEASWSYT